MSNPLEAAGGLPQPSEYATLNMDRYITGIDTHRSPLRDAAVPYVQAKFYSAGRFDSLWDGLNVEVTAELTLARRPGLSIYNSRNFAPSLRFYDFRTVIDGVAGVRVINDTAARAITASSFAGWSMTVSLPYTNVVLGQPLTATVSFAGYVNNTVPTGNVTLSLTSTDGLTHIATVALSSGQAMGSITDPRVNPSGMLTVTYGGDATYPQFSASIPYTVISSASGTLGVALYLGTPARTNGPALYFNPVAATAGGIITAVAVNVAAYVPGDQINFNVLNYAPTANPAAPFQNASKLSLTVESTGSNFYTGLNIPITAGQMIGVEAQSGTTQFAYGTDGAYPPSLNAAGITGTGVPFATTYTGPGNYLLLSATTIVSASVPVTLTTPYGDTVTQFAGQVIDATGPSTSNVLWTKSFPNPGRKTSFQSVGNTLYFSNGADNKKWVLSAKGWGPAKLFSAGDWIVDTNNNVQLLQPQQAQRIASVAIAGNVVTILFNGPSPFSATQQVALSGLTAAAFLNGKTLVVTAPASPTPPTGDTYRGAWAGTNNYAVNDLVTYGGAEYLCTVAANTTPAGGGTTSGNLFNYQAVTANGEISIVDGTVATINGYTCSDFTYVHGAGTFVTNMTLGYFSGNGYQLCMAFYDQNKAFLSGYSPIGTSPGGPGVINPNTPVTVPANAWYVRFYVQPSASTVNGSLSTAIVNAGSTLQSSYTPYNPGSTTPAIPSPAPTDTTHWQLFALLSFVNGFQAAFTHADYPQANDTGTASSGAASGATGGSQPAWNTLPGGLTNDGALQWYCWGSSIQNWGIQPPAQAPGVTQASLPQNYPPWQANTYYSTTLAIQDANGNIQKLTSGGLTGTAAPTWATAKGTTTTEAVTGGAVWTCNGTASWQAGTLYQVGDTIVITYTYYVQVYVPNYDNQNEYNRYENGGNYGNNNNNGGYYESQPVTVTEMFACATAGSSAYSQPDWSTAPGGGSSVTDATVTWRNLGAVVTWASFGAGASLSLNRQIADSNGNLQTLTTPGKSAATAPTWATTQGATTTESTGVAWSQSGAYSTANTGAWRWAFAYKNSIDGTVSSVSPSSVSLVLGQGKMPVLQGQTSTDPQTDTIVVFRTNQAGSLLLYLDEFQQTAGAIWTYQDTNPDGNLNAELLAPLNGVNNPPPPNITSLAYHLGRVWAGVGNLAYFCTGPDTTFGNGRTAWSAGNVFGFPDGIAALIPVNVSNGALLVFTASAVESVMGLGTTSSGFYPATYAAGIGLLSGDAIDVIGSTIHLFTTTGKQISLDPSAGYIETGFPIGDQFEEVTTGGIEAPLYAPEGVYVTWHEAGSGDTGLFVADGAVGWFRYSPVSSPESGFLWSPRAAIEGGTSAVRSVETKPGIRSLLVGPPVNGPVLMRDDTVNSDNLIPYDDTYAVIGSVQLAQSGQVAEVAWITLDSRKVGTAPTVGLLLGEIEPTANVPFEMLAKTSDDPPLLPPSETLYAERFNALQGGNMVLCRHLQIKIQWSSEDAPSELFQHAIYGAMRAERRQQ